MIHFVKKSNVFSNLFHFEGQFKRKWQKSLCWELVSLLKGSAIFIERKTKIYAKYELKLRYLSTKNFLLRSSSLRFNVVLGKLSVLKRQKLFYKRLFKESTNRSLFKIIKTEKKCKWSMTNIAKIVEPKNMTQKSQDW